MSKIETLPFKKERLILLDALESFSFLDGMPETLHLTKNELLEKLIDPDEKDALINVKIDIGRFFTHNLLFEALVTIFENDLLESKVDVYPEIQRVIDIAFNNMEKYEETKFILEEYEYKDTSWFTPIKNKNSILLESVAVGEYGKFVSNSTIFIDATLKEILSSKKKPVTPVYKVLTSYALVDIMKSAVYANIENTENKSANILALNTIKYMEECLVV